MAKGKKGSLKAKILASLGVLIVAITALWGYNHYIAEQKLNNLYKHGFRLLEEQTALYIKEHYSGVSKIEFSPIFVDGDGRFTVRTLNVVPVVYDNHGNRALLGEPVDGSGGQGGYGLLEGLSDLDFDLNGDHVIYLSESLDSSEIDVSMHQNLPSEAKLSSSEKIDENIQALVDDKQLEDVEKSSKGSPKAEISYNLEIKKGSHSRWR